MAQEQKIIFISSTFEDLKEHRRILRDAIEGSGFGLLVMESQGARPRTTAAECRRWARAADVFVGLLGMRYGSRERESQKSFTEIEFDEATNAGKPCLMYLMDEEYPLPRKWMDTGRDADDLSAFKQRVDVLVKPDRFSSPDNAAHKVLRDLTILLADQGWLSRPKIHGIGEREWPKSEAAAVLELPLDSWDSAPYRLPLHEITDHVRADMAAGLLAGMFRRGDFSALQNVVSINRNVWDSLSAFLRGTPVDQDRLAVEILRTGDAFYLRLLVIIAGEVSAATCVEGIAVRTLQDGKEIDDTLQEYRYSMRSFRDVVRGALSNMPRAVIPTLERFCDSARDRRWQAHQLFAKAAKEIAKRGVS